MTTPRWDAVLRESAEDFLSSLSPQEEAHCRQVILNVLCDNPLPANNPGRRELRSQPGVMEAFTHGWHFRYGILNANTIVVYAIFYSPNNPRHPIFGTQPDIPPPPEA